MAINAILCRQLLSAVTGFRDVALTSGVADHLHPKKESFIR